MHSNLIKINKILMIYSKFRKCLQKLVFDFSLKLAKTYIKKKLTALCKHKQRLKKKFYCL